MSRWFDNILVGLALLASIGYAIAALGPRSLKPRLLAALGQRLAATGRFPGLLNIVRRLQAKPDAKAAGACGGCDNCGSATTTATATAQPPAQPAGDVRIPIAKIGRRT